MLLRSYETLDETVYTKVKEMIVNQELKPGDLIVQNQLAQVLGVSRTPLRKAIGELEVEGLLVRTTKGWYVKEFTLQDMLSIFEIRAVLEGLACRLAVLNITKADIAYMRALFQDAYKQIDKHQAEAYYHADVKFHNMIVEIADDEMLRKTIESQKIIATSQIQGLYRDPAETYDEHMKIIDALEARNGDLAEQLICEHLRKSASVIRSGKYHLYK
ncbi:GntR family transcriptional regulator [Ammoniphilus sp. YIM 78166]|uniref:GntR family transcriptional regulator n=1 Tax=Ammoniphilus sp. YIM 78166 TaxID=1644106 RepID=UPI00106FCD64|nr:GntR family transcriptional regulator [Ammoniphilus sp. YIM 78166]